MSCVFCKILNREIPSAKVFEDESLYAFRDLNPVAPTHILLIPKKHIESMDQLRECDEALAGHLLVSAAELARKEGLAQRGYRLIINTKEDGGQSVPHLHLHIIGGRPLKWDN